jgi:hypothetical protein
MKLMYCDYIADLISRKLKLGDDLNILKSVSMPKLDLDIDGAFNSTKKIVKVTDKYGVEYLITVEAV